MAGIQGLGRMPSLVPTGSIHMIIGPMFSGKSTELLRRMRRYSMAKYNCMLVKYSNDTRYGEGVVTHDRVRSDAVACAKLEEIKERAAKYDVVGIDEGQFFPDVVGFAEEMANKGKLVIIAALDGTFQRKPFGDILELIPMAESVIKLTAVCMVCSSEASFSKRLGSETEVEVIGGADKYIAVCRQCFNKPDISNDATPTKEDVQSEKSVEGITRNLFATNISSD